MVYSKTSNEHGAYRLEFPAGAKFHDVFHVSKLKKFIGEPDVQRNPLPHEFINQQPILKPVAVLDKRTMLIKGHTIPQLLIQWEG